MGRRNKSNLNFGSSAKDRAEYMNKNAHAFTPGGIAVVEHVRKGKLLSRQQVKNAIASVGLHKVLDQAFRGQTGHDPWYIGLVDNAGFSAFANADTMGSHAGWTEFEDYDEATREEWDTVAAASRAIANTTAAEFTINASGTVHGFFVTSSNTKGGTTGTLWATGALSTNRAVVDDDLIRIIYTVTGPA